MGSVSLLRRRLALTTVLTVVPLFGYGRQAFAACDLSGAPIVVCSGENFATQNIPVDGADVSTAPGFSVDTAGDGVVITGEGHLRFTDENETTIAAGGDGLSVTASDGAVPGAVTITTNGSIAGGLYGIDARNSGGGSIAITVDGDVSGNFAGIYARNSGTDLNITTGPDSLVSSGRNGIEARNHGSGSLTITAYGSVTGEDNNGIYARNNAGIGLEVTTYSTVSSGGSGINARNYGSGNLDVEAHGDVTGTNFDGIYARNTNGVDLTITTAADTTVMGGSGIRAKNYGSGDLEITADSDVMGTNYDGIYARNNNGVNLTITAASLVTGENGIEARNYGTGNLEIQAHGQVTGTSFTGIYAKNNSNGVDLTITTGPDSLVSGEWNGIEARTHGSGSLTVTAYGAVTGEDNNGIYARNNAGIDLTVTTYSTVSSGGSGINARNYGNGDLAVEAHGDVTGTSFDGIYARNTNGVDLTITTAAATTVMGGRSGIGARNYGSGALQITVNGEATGETGDGIFALIRGEDALGMEIKVGAGGLVQGNAQAISAQSDHQEISIVNDGVVRNLSGESDDAAIFAIHGAADIENNGELIGFVTLDTLHDELPFNDKITNNGIWNTANGVSDFGLGETDQVINGGTLLAADGGGDNEITRFNNLEAFNNSGLVTLADGMEGDELHLGILDDQTDNNTDYEGENGRLAVDAVLGPTSAGSLSDRIIISGSTGGTTRVFVNVIDVTGTNTGGIPVIEVDDDTAEGHFELGAPVNAGFFTWDLQFDDAENWHELVTSGIGVGAYEFAAGIGGAQEVWHQTTGTILQRQADLRVLFENMNVTPVADYAEPVAPTPVAHITPGFWFRGVGAYIERDDKEDGFTLDREQTVWGGMAGFDWGHENADSAWLFGIFAGYLTSDLEFDETNTEWNYEGPTIGAYVTYLDHGFYADLTVKADFLDIEIDPEDLAPASDDADTDATNLGGRFDTGYKFGSTFFIEPQATLAIVHTEIDDVEIFGGNVEFDDETSVRGRLGLRLGFDQPSSDGTVYSGDVTASVWEDFSGDNDVSITDPTFGTFGASDDQGQTYGDVALGFSVAAPEGWSGFIRGNYLFAEDYEAVTGNAGVRWAW